MSKTDRPASSADGLAKALRGIRRLRGKRTGEVAASLNLALRSYEHFESGAGRLNVERVHHFADATDSDGYAILVSLWIGSPEFAVRCARNKLMTVLVMGLQDLDVAAGDALAHLDARTIIGVLQNAFGALADEARQRDAAAAAWLADRAERLPQRRKRPDQS